MAVTPGAGAAWPPGGEPEGAPRGELHPELEACSGPVIPGRWAPNSFSGQEVVDFPTQLEEDLKDRKGQGQGGEVRPPSMPRQRRPRAATGPSTGCERQGGR